MPRVMQRTLELMQARIGPIIHKFQDGARTAAAELKAAAEKPAAGDTAAAKDAP